jgi:GR25 family glycosyltransferase involved in LPS biosynthesis
VAPVDAATAGQPATGWDFFDRIYCISLEEREDRRRSAVVQFAKVGLENRVEFVIVKRHPVDVEQGIYESHMTCLRRGLAAGAQRIVVFEDDVCFDRFDAGRLRRCTRFLADHPHWKVLLFGALIRASSTTAESAVQRVAYQSLAHAYALNRPYAETIAYRPWQGIVADEIFRPLTEGLYAVCPMFAFQSNSATDNKFRQLDLFRRSCGGLKRIQWGIEFFYRYKTAIIAAHALALLVLGTFLLCR